MEMVASGVSSPGRVRKYMRIGTAVEARKPSPHSAYFIASRARRQPRALSLKVALRAVIANFTRGDGEIGEDDLDRAEKELETRTQKVIAEIDEYEAERLG